MTNANNTTEMTFLEFVAERLMGPPLWRSAGRAVWPCPYHSPDVHASFNTLPQKAGCKDRFRCWTCGEWGDVFDLLKLFFKGEDYDQRRARLETLRADYEAEQKQGHDHQGQGQRQDAANPIYHRGGGVADRRKVDAAWADLLQELAARGISRAVGFFVLSRCLRVAEANGVTMEALTDQWERYDEWIEDTAAAHLIQCADEDCEAAVCRIARGLEPITEAQLDAERLAKQEAQRERQALLRRAVRNIRRPMPRGGL